MRGTSHQDLGPIEAHLPTLPQPVRRQVPKSFLWARMSMRGPVEAKKADLSSCPKFGVSLCRQVGSHYKPPSGPTRGPEAGTGGQKGM